MMVISSPLLHRSRRRPCRAEELKSQRKRLIERRSLKKIAWRRLTFHSVGTCARMFNIRLCDIVARTVCRKKWTKNGYIGEEKHGGGELGYHRKVVKGEKGKWFLRPVSWRKETGKKGRKKGNGEKNACYYLCTCTLTYVEEKLEEKYNGRGRKSARGQDMEKEYAVRVDHEVASALVFAFQTRWWNTKFSARGYTIMVCLVLQRRDETARGCDREEHVIEESVTGKRSHQPPVRSIGRRFRWSRSDVCERLCIQRRSQKRRRIHEVVREWEREKNSHLFRAGTPRTARIPK